MRSFGLCDQIDKFYITFYTVKFTSPISLFYKVKCLWRSRYEYCYHSVDDNLLFGRVWKSQKTENNFIFKSQAWFGWEGVGTSNFTTTTGHFFQNIEIVFLVHHYYYNQNIESVFWVHHYYDTFDVLILPMASKKITTSKIEISTTYGVLPMVTKACGALGG